MTITSDRARQSAGWMAVIWTLLTIPAQARFSLHRFPSTQSTALVFDQDPIPEVLDQEQIRGSTSLTRLTQRLGVFWTDPDTRDQIALILGYARGMRFPKSDDFQLAERSDDNYSAALTLPFGRLFSLALRDEFRQVRYLAFRDASYKRNSIGPEFTYNPSQRFSMSAGYAYSTRRARRATTNFQDYTTHGAAMGLQWRPLPRNLLKLSYVPTLRDFSFAEVEEGRRRRDLLHPILLEYQRRFGLQTQMANGIEYRRNQSNDSFQDFWQIRARSSWIFSLSPSVSLFLGGSYTHRRYGRYLESFVAAETPDVPVEGGEEQEGGEGGESGGTTEAPAFEGTGAVRFQGEASSSAINLERRDHRFYGNAGLSITFFGRLSVSFTYGLYKVIANFPVDGSSFQYKNRRIHLGLAVKI